MIVLFNTSFPNIHLIRFHTFWCLGLISIENLFFIIFHRRTLLWWLLLLLFVNKHDIARLSIQHLKVRSIVGHYIYVLVLNTKLVAWFHHIVVRFIDLRIHINSWWVPHVHWTVHFFVLIDWWFPAVWFMNPQYSISLSELHSFPNYLLLLFLLLVLLMMINITSLMWSNITITKIVADSSCFIRSIATHLQYRSLTRRLNNHRPVVLILLSMLRRTTHLIFNPTHSIYLSLHLIFIIIILNPIPIHIHIHITITIHIHIHIPIRISFFTPTFINSLFKSSDFLLLMLHNLSPLFFDRLILLLQPSFSLLLNLHLLLHPLTLLTDLLLHILPFFQIFLQNLDLPWIPILLQHLILLHFLQLFF